MRHKSKTNVGILLRWLQFHKHSCVLNQAMSLARPSGATVPENNPLESKGEAFILWLLRIYCLSLAKICPKGICSLTLPGCVACTSWTAAEECRIITLSMALHLSLEFVGRAKASVGGISLGLGAIVVGASAPLG